jgi:membrane-bound inhibitor of C-type lysozyme
MNNTTLYNISTENNRSGIGNLKDNKPLGLKQRQGASGCCYRKDMIVSWSIIKSMK